jgi:hypothetical protein
MLRRPKHSAIEVVAPKEEDFAEPPSIPLSENHLYRNLLATQRPTRNVWLNFALLLRIKDSTSKV